MLTIGITYAFIFTSVFIDYVTHIDALLGLAEFLIDVFKNSSQKRGKE